jgi:hypothetical protein
MAKFRLDAHGHSMFSGDSYLKRCTPERILENSIKAGLDGLVITDTRVDMFFDAVADNPRRHIPFSDEIFVRPDLIYFRDYRNNRWLSIFRGMEYHDEKGHLLVICNEKKIEYNHKYDNKDRIKQAHDHGGLVGVAHPFYLEYGGTSRKEFEKIAEDLDFVEIFNPLSKPEFNNAAKQAAKEYGLPGLCNSDFHDCKPARAYTTLDISYGIFDKVGERVKDAINKDRVINCHEEYVSTLGKVNTFIIQRLLNGDVRSVAGLFTEPFKKKLKR